MALRSVFFAGCVLLAAGTDVTQAPDQNKVFPRIEQDDSQLQKVEKKDEPWEGEQKEQPQQKEWNQYMPKEFGSFFREQRQQPQQQNWDKFIPKDYRKIAEKEQAQNSKANAEITDPILLIASDDAPAQKEDQPQKTEQKDNLQNAEQKEQAEEPKQKEQPQQKEWKQYMPKEYEAFFGEQSQQSQQPQQKNWDRFVPKDYRNIADREQKQHSESEMTADATDPILLIASDDALAQEEVHPQELDAKEKHQTAQQDEQKEQPQQKNWKQYMPRGFLSLSGEEPQQPQQPQQINWEQFVPKQYQSIADDERYSDIEAKRDVVDFGAIAKSPLAILPTVIFFALSFAAFVSSHRSRRVANFEVPLLA